MKATLGVGILLFWFSSLLAVKVPVHCKYPSLYRSCRNTKKHEECIAHCAPAICKYPKVYMECRLVNTEPYCKNAKCTGEGAKVGAPQNILEYKPGKPGSAPRFCMYPALLKKCMRKKKYGYHSCVKRCAPLKCKYPILYMECRVGGKDETACVLERCDLDKETSAWK